MLNSYYRFVSTLHSVPPYFNIVKKAEINCISKNKDSWYFKEKDDFQKAYKTLFVFLSTFPDVTSVTIDKQNNAIIVKYTDLNDDRETVTG